MSKVLPSILLALECIERRGEGDILVKVLEYSEKVEFLDLVVFLDLDVLTSVTMNTSFDWSWVKFSKLLRSNFMDSFLRALFGFLREDFLGLGSGDERGVLIRDLDLERVSDISKIDICKKNRRLYSQYYTNIIQLNT